MLGFRMGRRRSEAEVLVDVLSVALGDVRVTHLMYRANLSYSTLHRYLFAALDRGLICKVNNSDGSVVYRTTEKGKAVLERLRDAKYSLFG
jgi:predicted transcriptional regulator